MDFRFTFPRAFAAVGIFAAAIWFGQFAPRNLPILQSAHRGFGLMFALGMAYIGVAVAFFIVSGRMDAVVRVFAEWRQRLRRALVVLTHGQTDCGPFRVISLRSGAEMARFTTAQDAFAWVNGSSVLDGAQGVRYEVRNMAGDVIARCKCSA